MKGEKYSRTELCALTGHTSLKEYLEVLLGLSQNKLKEALTKAQLARVVGPRDVVSLPLALVNRALINPHYLSSRQVTVISEDKDVIALSKPAGIHGHPMNYEECDTVLNFLRTERRDIPWDDFHSPEKGLLYRLDRETSGLLLFIKSASLHHQLRQNFQALVKEKIYFALVEGNLEHRGEFSCALESFGPKGAQMRLSRSGGEEATLAVEAVEYFAKRDVSLVKVRLYSGSRHQIRVQLKILGHPIVGDELYQGREAERLFLHCYRYTLELSELKVFCDQHFELLGDYLGIDGGLQVFGDKLLIGQSR